MLFQRRYERARQLQKEQMKDAPPALLDDDIADRLEKHDLLAIILSALITIVPAVLLFLLVLSGIGYFFIVR